MKKAHWISVATLAAMLGWMPAAHAEIFKCKGPDGKIVMSDVRCDGDTPPKAAAKKDEKDTSGRYQLTDADKARIKTLEGVMDNKASNSEQRSAAQWEVSNIRRGIDAQMTAQDREKREQLVAQLSTADAKKRTELLNQIRKYYDK